MTGYDPVMFICYRIIKGSCRPLKVFDRKPILYGKLKSYALPGIVPLYHMFVRLNFNYE